MIRKPLKVMTADEQQRLTYNKENLFSSRNFVPRSETFQMGRPSGDVRSPDQALDNILPGL